MSPAPCSFALVACFSLVAAAEASGQVSIEAVPLFTEVEQGQSLEQSIMLRLQSPDLSDIQENMQDEVNSQQDLVVVLDVSGSMRTGAKLEKAKAAITGIIDGLRPTDRLHLITYHSSARVEFTDGMANKKEDLKAHVAELSPQSSTNLYAGLQAAERIIGGRSESDLYSSVRSLFSSSVEPRSRSVKRIFLFSDGLVNAGVTDRGTILKKVEHLREQGTITSAFGIGADYDQALMSAIAEVGHGEFFFIRGQEDMEKVVRVATASFQSLFATEAWMRLTPLNGATALRVHGQSHNQRAFANYTEVTLGDLRGGDARTMLVDLLIPGLTHTTEYLAYELRYTAAGSKEPTEQHGRISVHVVPAGVQPAEPNNAVMLFRKLQQHLHREEEIEREIESGDIRRAEFLEDGLESDLRDVRDMACSSQGTQEEAYTCSRAKAAWGRTKQSQDSFKGGSMHGEIASKAYKFKRLLNSELSEAYDEL